MSTSFKAVAALLALGALCSCLSGAVAERRLLIAPVTDPLGATDLAKAMVNTKDFVIVMAAGKAPKYEGRKAANGLIAWRLKYDGLVARTFPMGSVVLTTGAAKEESACADAIDGTPADYGEPGYVPPLEHVRPIPGTAAKLPEVPHSRNGVAITFRIKAKRDGHLHARFMFFSNRLDMFSHHLEHWATYMFLVNGKNKALLSDGRTMTTANWWEPAFDTFDAYNADPPVIGKHVVYDQSAVVPGAMYGRITEIRSVKVHKGQEYKIRILVADGGQPSGGIYEHVSSVYFSQHGIRITSKP